MISLINMAIITNIVTGTPMIQSVLADSQETKFIQLPSVGTEVDFCTCDYKCDYINYVFADASSSDYKNDKSSFLIGLVEDSAVLEIRLVGNGQDVVITDNTFGTYYAKGTFTSTPNQANYVGFIADWKKILTAFGGGQYKFVFKETVFSQDFETESVKYKLSTFTDAKANKTVRLRFQQNGIIEGGLDYRGLNWITEIRIDASLKYNAPILTIDNYQTSTRTIRQIQDKIIESFELETYLIPSKIGDLFVKNGVLANNILITNYDLFAYKKYVDFPCVITEISDFKGNYKINTLASFTFAIEERVQNNVKRNV